MQSRCGVLAGNNDVEKLEEEVYKSLSYECVLKYGISYYVLLDHMGLASLEKRRKFLFSSDEFQ